MEEKVQRYVRKMITRGERQNEVTTNLIEFIRQYSGHKLPGDILSCVAELDTIISGNFGMEDAAFGNSDGEDEGTENESEAGEQND